MLIVRPGTYPVDNVRMQGLAVRGLGGRWMSVGLEFHVMQVGPGRLSVGNS